MPTWADLKARVEQELDLVDEDFVNSTELLSYANRAINKAESIILDLSEDYFLAEPTIITLVSGQATYSLPSDCYGQKIRILQYDNGTWRYQIKKITELNVIPFIQPQDKYRYVVTNSYTNGVKVRLYPTPLENGDVVTLWYLRSSRALAADADVLDLPEAYDYVTQYIKDMVINKERMQPDAAPSASLLKEEQLLIQSLHQRTVDEQIVSLEEVQGLIDDGQMEGVS